MTGEDVIARHRHHVFAGPRIQCKKLKAAQQQFCASGSALRPMSNHRLSLRQRWEATLPELDAVTEPKTPVDTSLSQSNPKRARVPEHTAPFLLIPASKMMMRQDAGATHSDNVPVQSQAAVGNVSRASDLLIHEGLKTLGPGKTGANEGVPRARLSSVDQFDSIPLHVSGAKRPLSDITTVATDIKGAVQHTLSLRDAPCALSTASCSDDQAQDENFMPAVALNSFRSLPRLLPSAPKGLESRPRGFLARSHKWRQRVSEAGVLWSTQQGVEVKQDASEGRAAGTPSGIPAARKVQDSLSCQGRDVAVPPTLGTSESLPGTQSPPGVARHRHVHISPLHAGDSLQRATQVEKSIAPIPLRADTCTQKGRKRAPKAGEVSDNFIALNLKRHGTARHRKVRSAKAVARRAAWIEAKMKDHAEGNDGKREKEHKARDSGRSLDTLDACLNILDEFARAGQRQAKDSIVEKALMDLQEARPSEVDEVSDSIIIALAPQCPHHQQPSRLLRVRKAGPNKNRRFYACSFPRGEACGFFMWVENNPMLVAGEMRRDGQEEGDHSYWGERQLNTWRRRFAGKTVAELQVECKRRRIEPGGRKDCMVKNLVEEVRKVTDGAHTSPVSINDRSIVTDSSAEEGAEKGGEENWTLDLVSSEDGPLEPADGAGLAEAKQGVSNKQAEAVSGIEEDSHCFRQLDRTKALRADLLIKAREDPAYAGPSEKTASKASAKFKTDFRNMKADEQREARGKRIAHKEAPLQMTTGRELSADRAKAYLHNVFGHTDFRDGQLWAIRRGLSSARSLFVLPTGSGKSLTYQMIALLSPQRSLSIVISPLISLMMDQLAHLPPQLPGACLSGNLSMREMARIVEDLRTGRLRLLFLSPEKLCSDSFRRLVHGSAAAKAGFPPVNLVCLDEAHCLSQWSHNFRPAFLQLGGVIETLLKPKSLLAMTATADPDVVQDVCTRLRIPTEGVQLHSWRRGHLHLRVEALENDQSKRQWLIAILSEPRYAKGAVIIYVRRQRDAEVLRDYLASYGASAVTYHAGMDFKQREIAQRLWTRQTGKARICVATVAFGLGIDKQDVRAVIHYEMPKTVENLIQETGRAGRDGREAWCPTLLSQADFRRQHSLAHSDGVTCLQIMGLLGILMTSGRRAKVLEGSEEGQKEARTQVALDSKALATALDMREEVLQTALVLLSMPPWSLLKMHGDVQDDCQIVFRKRPPSNLRVSETIIDRLMQLDAGKSTNSSERAAAGSGLMYGYGSATFSLIRLVNALGSDWKPYEVVRELLRLQDAGEIEYIAGPGRSYHLTLLAYGAEAKDITSLSANTTAIIVNDLFRQMQQIEQTSIIKLEHVYGILRTVATLPDKEQEDKINELIHAYMDKGEVYCNEATHGYPALPDAIKAAIQRDSSTFFLTPGIVLAIHQIVSRARNSRPAMQSQQSPDTIPHSSDLAEAVQAYKAQLAARVFHGISSPNLPAAEWRESPFWMKYKDWKFEDVQSALCEALGPAGVWSQPPDAMRGKVATTAPHQAGS